MDIKKLFIGTIAGAVVFFFLGWLVYGTLLESFMRHNPGEIGHVDRKEMDFLFLTIGQVLQGLLLTYILLRANANSVGAGLMMGAVVGFLIAAAVDCTMYGTTIILSKKAIAADVVSATIISAIAGAVIGAVTGGKKA